VAELHEALDELEAENKAKQLKEVSFAYTLGLFCLYTRSLLPMY